MSDLYTPIFGREWSGEADSHSHLEFTPCVSTKQTIVTKIYQIKIPNIVLLLLLLLNTFS